MRFKQWLHEMLGKMNLEVNRANPRPFDRFLVRYYEKPKGIEIGVYEGEHAKYLLNSKTADFLFLVDDYKYYDEVREKFSDAFTRDVDKAKEIMLRVLEQWEDKYELIELNSDDAHIRFKKEQVDFVYIDGGHSYEQVRKDIANYWWKVKKGGMFGGHDFTNGVGDETKGVVKAVMEFVIENNLKDSFHTHGFDWWVVKPEDER